MKTAELRNKDVAGLQAEVKDLQKAHFNLRMQKATQQLSNTLGAEVNTTMNAELAKTLKGLEKEESKAISKNGKALAKEQQMKKKADDLEREIKKNDEAQVLKKKMIAEQETLVRSLKEKLDSIQ